MANKYKGEIAFTAGEDSFVLRFSANAVVAIEDEFDQTINQLGKLMSDPEKLRLSVVKKMFCIGLADHYAETRPEIDRGAAETIFGRLGPVEATSLVVNAFTSAFELADGGQAAAAKNPPQAPAETTADGTGSVS
ncbi:hypothetical protein EOW77_0003605 [Bradyrhizobium yuanmingense]|uniref:hypothetical protein n=1 Tax=Bradyrhizobium yuanmingense TaxID=108015 RepID=UPI000FE3F26C|nr:hypothetical protein [Bradyrhizobium yuanmingense]TGN89423.1 hypothetical protein EOW77_0003605 [Bradyrhizobium yuanmingense]